jgi:hypothetical protein
LLDDFFKNAIHRSQVKAYFSNFHYCYFIYLFNCSVDCCIHLSFIVWCTCRTPGVKLLPWVWLWASQPLASALLLLSMMVTGQRLCQPTSSKHREITLELTLMSCCPSLANSSIPIGQVMVALSPPQHTQPNWLRLRP